MIPQGGGLATAALADYHSRMKTYDVLSLYSGGLDSILAAKILEEQGLKVLCLHFVSPFFGDPSKVRHWREIYGLSIEPVDLAGPYVEMLSQGPRFGLGKVLNPCVDCKIMLLSKAKEMLGQYGAKILATGEVVGQRPMSQRVDALNLIKREAGVADVLLRPLCAKRLPPSKVEELGLVDRERLCAFSGRGRKDQLDLAKHFGLAEIPTPAGGCRLTELESARRYYPILKHFQAPTPADFDLSNIGRQYWSGPRWLSVGRNRADNERLESLVREGDLLFKVKDFPGPLGVLRPAPGLELSQDEISDAAGFVASFSPKAREAGGAVRVLLAGQGQPGSVLVIPGKDTPLGWREPTWDEVAAAKTLSRQRESALE